MLSAMLLRFFFVKVIQVHFFDHLGAGRRHADAMVDHQLGQLLAIDQHDLLINMFDEIPSVLGESPPHTLFPWVARG